MPVSQPGPSCRRPRTPRTRTRCWAASSPAARPPSATPGCPCARPVPRPAACSSRRRRKPGRSMRQPSASTPATSRVRAASACPTARWPRPPPPCRRPRWTRCSSRQPASFTQIGKAGQRRLDTPAKLRGERLFGIDAKQPGMVHAALAQCPVIGGTVVSVDDSKARAMPGVRAVINLVDGVAVVADHFWTAKKARDALEVKWLVGAAGSVSSDSVGPGTRTGHGQGGAQSRGKTAMSRPGSSRRARPWRPGTNCRCWPTWRSSR